MEVPTHLIDLDPATCRAARRDERRLDHWCSAPSRRRHRPGRGLSRADRLPPRVGHSTVWHVAGPRDWDAAQKRLHGWRSALRDAGRRVPRVLYGDWSAASGTNKVASWQPETMSPQSSPPTTRWQWGSFEPSTRRAGRSPATYRSSASTMSRGRVPDGAVDHGWRRRGRGCPTHSGRAAADDRRCRPTRDAVTLPGTKLIIRALLVLFANGRRPKFVTEAKQIFSPTTEHN